MPNESLLVTLSEHCMDGSCSLADLLRECLMLGARTGSDALREWARQELHGYNEGVDVPAYRRRALPLFVDTLAGTFHRTGEQINRFQIPTKFRNAVPEFVEFRQPIEELESMAAEPQPNRITLHTFPLVTATWSEQLPPYTRITSMYYGPTRSTFVAMVGTVRTALVEIVADLVSEAPITLPSKAKVDSAVSVRINNVSGDHNEVSVASNSGAVGAGTRSRQTVNTGILPDELTALFASVRDLAAEVGNEDDRADVEQAIDDFEGEVTQAEPQPGKVRIRARALLALCEKIALPALTSAVTALTTSGLAELGIG